MKKTLIVAIAVIFLLQAWVSAERSAGTLNMNLVTSFDFSHYPACGLSRSSYCIQAIRFYDPDSKTRLAEVPVNADMTGQQVDRGHCARCIPFRATPMQSRYTWITAGD